MNADREASSKPAVATTTAGCSFLGGAMARMMGFRGRACIGPDGANIASLKTASDTAKDDLRENVRRIYGTVTAA